MRTARRSTALTCATAAVLVLALGVAGAAAAPTGVNITTVEGQSFSGRVATGLQCPLQSATISWGDGTTSAGTSDGNAGINGTHTYAEEGSYNGSVAYAYQPQPFSCPSTAQPATFQATVSDASLSATGQNVSGSQGQPLSAPVAHFADADPGGAAADYAATVHWGDGTTSPGTVTASSSGGFDVSGTHTYAGAGSFAVSVAITDTGASTTTATGSAAIAPATATTTTSTTATTSGPPPASPTPPRVVSIDPVGPPAAGAPIVLKATTSGPVTAIQWNLAGDATPEITCAGAQTAVTFRAPAGARSVSAVAIGPAGPGPALDTSVTVAPSAGLSAAQRRLAGHAGRALARKAPVYECAAPDDFKLVPVGHSPTNLTLSDQAQTENCVTPRTVVEGGLQFEGCFKQVTSFSQIPKAELGVWYPAAKALGIPGPELTAIPFHNGRGLDKVRDLVVNLPDVYITYGAVKVNGLTLDPGAGAAIVIAPQLNAIVSSNAGMAVGGLALNGARSFDLNLDPSGGQIPLGSFTRAAGGLADIAGFALGGNVRVALDDSGGTFGLTVRVHLALPDWLQVGGVSVQGDVTLRATNADGLVIDNLRIGPIDAEIAGLGIDGLQLDYARATQEWAGQGRACIVDGACLDMIPPNGGVVIRNGALVRVGASLDFPSPGLELFAGVALNRIGFGVGLDPTRLLANANITAEGVLEIDGHLVLAFPSAATPFILDPAEVDSDPSHPSFPADFYNRRYTETTFAVAADAYFDLPLAGRTRLGGAYLLYQYPGYVGFGGGIGAHFAGIIDLTGRVDGEFNFGNGRFSIKGDIEACVADVICASAIGAISDNGAGGCVHIGTFFGDINVGGGVRFSPFHIYFWPFDGCRWSPFVDTHVFSARAAGAGTPIRVRLGRGAQGRAIELDGVGGAPAVRVQTPGGAVLQSPAASGLALSPAIRIMRSEKFDTTVVGLVHPTPGTYTVTLLPGSAAVNRVRQASDQPRARIRASVRGDGAQRTLSYVIARRTDQQVRFIEHIAHGGSRIIGTVNGGGRGQLRFTPSPGNDRRTIIAQFALAGLPAETVTIAAFTPPSPRLGTPPHLTVSRRRLALRVSWGPTAGATSYTVVARLAGGERVVRTRRRTISITHVPRSDGGVISVLAVATLRHGRPALRRISGIGRAGTRLALLPRAPRR